jgi:hypothetical protein
MFTSTLSLGHQRFGGVRGTGATDRDARRKECNSEEGHGDLKIRPDVMRTHLKRSAEPIRRCDDRHDDTDAETKTYGKQLTGNQTWFHSELAGVMRVMDASLW